MPRTTSICIGSHPAIPATSVTVTANGSTEALDFDGGAFYLYHATAGLSLLNALRLCFDSHSQLAGTSVAIVRSGLVRVENGTAFSVDNWGTDTTLRDLLGFTSGTGSAVSHLADTLSPLYWAAGKAESSRAVMGSDGLPVQDTYAARSAPGQVVATRNNTWFENSFEWLYVPVARVETVPASNGTWATFWDVVLSRYRRFWIARNAIEDPTDDSAVMSLFSRVPQIGTAYVYAENGPLRRTHQREVERLERYVRIDLPVETALEYGA